MLPAREFLLIVLAGMGIGAVARVWMERAGVERSGEPWLGAVPGTNVGPAEVSPAVGRAVADGALAKEGELRTPETVEGILNAEGFEQAERLGRFLPLAQPADLERLWRGLVEARGYLEETLSDAIFLRWMTIDPAGGLDFAGKERCEATSWWAWGKVDPEAALAAALKEKQPFMGSSVVRAIAQSDPARARALIDRHPKFRDGNSMAGLAAGLMRIDPAAGATLAAAWNQSLNEGNHLSTWASRDPDAALAWAQELPDQTCRTEALGVLITQWAATNPEKIAPAIAALPEGRSKWKLYAEHASRLAAVDVFAARSWVEAAPNPRVREEALVHMARGLAATDPAAALQTLGAVAWGQRRDAICSLAVYQPSGTEYRGGDPAQLALAEISAVAPVQAMAFVTELSPEAQRAHLVPEVFEAWMRQDSMAASEWLALQPAGEIKDAATRALVRDLIRGVEPDFDAALQWALTLPKSNEQTLVASEVVIRWGKRDAVRARAALESPAVPSDLRAVMVKLFANP